MSKAKDYETKTTALITPIIDENGFELVDVEYVKEGTDYFLRAYIDKPGGITINDCEVVSRALSDKLDEDDFIEDAYILEVSSPGLDRPLKKDKDLERHLGDEVDVKLFKALPKDYELGEIAKKKEFRAVLDSYDEEFITFSLDNNNINICKLSRKDIALIRLAFDF